MFHSTNAIVRTLQQLSSNPDELEYVINNLKLACEFRNKCLNEEASRVSALAEGMPNNYRKQFYQALLFDRTDAPEYEKQMFQELQSIGFDKARTLVWDQDIESLIVDDVPLRIPQSIKSIDPILELRCHGFSVDDLAFIKSYIREHPGPWNFYSQVFDFIKQDGQIWAINKNQEKLAPLLRTITVKDFILAHQQEIESLTPLGQQTLMYYLSFDSSLLIQSNARTSLKQSHLDPNVIVLTEKSVGYEATFYLSRPQSSEEFFESFPVERFEFNIEQQHLFLELKQYLQSNQGDWNQKGLVQRFFVTEHGGVKYERIDAQMIEIPLRWPYGEFMKTFIDDNPSLDLKCKRIIERFIDQGKLSLHRGQVKSVYGNSQIGAFIVDHNERFIFAGFEKWEDPTDHIKSNLLLSDKSKKALINDINNNPDSPEWNSQGYIKDFVELDNGVQLIRFDDEKRFIPFLDA